MEGCKFEVTNQLIQSRYDKVFRTDLYEQIFIRMSFQAVEQSWHVAYVIVSPATINLLLSFILKAATLSSLLRYFCSLFLLQVCPQYRIYDFFYFAKAAVSIANVCVLFLSLWIFIWKCFRKYCFELKLLVFFPITLSRFLLKL